MLCECVTVPKGETMTDITLAQAKQSVLNLIQNRCDTTDFEAAKVAAEAYRILVDAEYGEWQMGREKVSLNGLTSLQQQAPADGIPGVD